MIIMFWMMNQWFSLTQQRYNISHTSVKKSCWTCKRITNKSFDPEIFAEIHHLWFERVQWMMNDVRETGRWRADGEPLCTCTWRRGHLRYCPVLHGRNSRLRHGGLCSACWFHMRYWRKSLQVCRQFTARIIVFTDSIFDCFVEHLIQQFHIKNDRSRFTSQPHTPSTRLFRPNSYQRECTWFTCIPTCTRGFVERWPLNRRYLQPWKRNSRVSIKIA